MAMAVQTTALRSRRAADTDWRFDIDRDNGSASGAYVGETYYGMPAVKASHYSWPIISYFFVGGLASASEFIATLFDLLGDARDHTVVRVGRYLALVGALISPALLIADLHTPQRWYNMLRIFRKTSPMSIGAWALTGFGLTSGLVAAGQGMEDLFGWRFGRLAARLFSMPAALLAAVVSLYTGTLLASTSTPFWARAFPFLSALFASSATSTATAALALATDVAATPTSTRRRLSWVGLVGGIGELAAAVLVGQHWHRRHGAARIETPSGAPTGWWVASVLGIVAPLSIHLFEMVSGRRSRRASVIAALATLGGGYILRAAFIRSGNESAKSPQEYFQFTQPGQALAPGSVPTMHAQGR
jgi:protein NrfD